MENLIRKAVWIKPSSRLYLYQAGSGKQIGLADRRRFRLCTPSATRNLTNCPVHLQAIEKVVLGAKTPGRSGQKYRR